MFENEARFEARLMSWWRRRKATLLVCIITGRVRNGATPGNLSARVASELANNDLVIQVGSWGWHF